MRECSNSRVLASLSRCNEPVTHKPDASATAFVVTISVEALVTRTVTESRTSYASVTRL